MKLQTACALIAISAVCCSGCSNRKGSEFQLDWPSTPSRSDQVGDGRQIRRAQQYMCAVDTDNKAAIYKLNLVEYVKPITTVEEKESTITAYATSKLNDVTSKKKLDIYNDNFFGYEIYAKNEKQLSRRVVFIHDTTLYDISILSNDKEYLESMAATDFLASFQIK